MNRILSHIINKPLLITPEKLQAIYSVISREKFSELDLVSTISPLAAAGEARQPNPAAANVAVIPIIGSLAHRSRGFLGSSGIRTYQAIREDFDRALADNEIDAIMFDIESNGGEVAGCFDLVDHIYKSRGIKPIGAHANEVAYSAGYALFSAVEKTYVTRTSGVGSVGVIMLHVDQSKFNKKMGIKVTPIYSGSHKNDFSPHQPISEGTLTELQQRVDETRALFAQTVARNRNLKLDQVLNTEAGLFQGTEAVKVGFADHMMTWQEALADLAGKIPKRKTRGTTMSMTTKERFAALLTNDDASAALTELGYVPADQVNHEAIKKAKAEGFQEALKHASNLNDICQLGNQSGMLSTFLKDGATVEDATARVIQRGADQDAGKKTDSTISTETTGKHPLIAACEKVATPQ